MLKYFLLLLLGCARMEASNRIDPMPLDPEPTRPYCTTQFMRGDLNQDHMVNILDVVIFYREKQSCLAQLDINDDGCIDTSDYLSLSMGMVRHDMICAEDCRVSYCWDSL